mmetsp:Transcript_524/g.656  ORF Transcript_524/g.656 Transcript_524/m.656 type:complete len:150 (+) Transcript_524:3497-3946(+)
MLDLYDLLPWLAALALIAFTVNYFRKKAVRLSRELNSKMVIVIRNDLGMGKGKIAAQCCHACLGAYKRAVAHNEAFLWDRYGSKKIVLKVDSEQELMHIFSLAEAEGVPAYLVRDAGLTQIPEGSLTALGLGPSSEETLAKLTGKLKLL